MTSRIELLGVGMLTLLAASCNGPATPHQIQNAHMDRGKELYGAELVTMADNAMVQDMTLSDFHFVAHTSELSGTGAARLDRMAGYLNTYGGTVRYATHLADGDLVAARMKHVGDYLELSGCDMDRIKIKQMISGGRTTPAEEAILADQRGTAEAESSPQSDGGAEESMLPQGQN